MLNYWIEVLKFQVLLEKRHKIPDLQAEERAIALLAVLPLPFQGVGNKCASHP
jgi:hypothetical protein